MTHSASYVWFSGISLPPSFYIVSQLLCSPHRPNGRKIIMLIDDHDK